MEICKRFKAEEHGAGIVEYALITALIGLMSFSAVTLLGEETSSTFDTVTDALEESGQPGASGGSIDMGNGDSGGSGGSNPATTSTTTPAASTTSTPATTTTTMPATTTTTAPATTTTNAPETTTTDASSGGAADASTGGGDQTAPKASSGGSEFYWWNADKHGGQGAWTASATYENETSRHQYLDLLVTRVDDHGRTTTLEVSGFYVPANEAATYTLWDNELDVHKDNVKGTVEVRIDVVSVTTSDEAWQPYSYRVASNPVTVTAPTAP